MKIDEPKIMYPSENQEVKLFFLNLTNQTKTVQFIVLALSVLIFNVWQGIISESVFKNIKYKEVTLFFVLTQWGFYALFSFIQLLKAKNYSLRKALAPK
jgi:hypothetical protein